MIETKTELMIVSGESTVTLADTVLEDKRNALTVAILVTAVTTSAENLVAVKARQELSAVAKSVEDARVKCKAPVLELGKRIDQAAKDFLAQIESEADRLKKLCDTFSAAELKRQREAEAARQAEEQRLQRVREAEEKRIREEAEARQKKIDADAKAAADLAAKATTADDKEDAEWEALRIKGEQEAADRATAEATAKANQSAVTATAALPSYVAKSTKGQAVTEDWVIDEIDNMALLLCRPDLVRTVEFDKVKLKAALHLANGILPGVKAHKEVTTKVRAAKDIAI